MKKSMEVDLTDLSLIMESFIKKLDKLSQPELIDLAARLKPVVKCCKTVDDHVKDVVKTELEHTAGELLGSSFKAVLKIIPEDRLDQTKLKEEKPAIWNAYLKHNEVERVSFELR